MTNTTDIEKRLGKAFKSTEDLVQISKDASVLLSALRTVEQALAEAKRENERLREALRQIAKEKIGPIPNTQSETIQLLQNTLIEQTNIAREALKGDPTNAN